MTANAPQHWVDLGATGGAPPSSPFLRAIYAIAEVMFTTAEGPPPPARLRWLSDRIAELGREVRGPGWLVLWLSVLLVSWFAPLLALRLPTLARMPLPARALALDRWERGPLGISLYAVKAILCIHYFEHPDAAREIGFDGRCLSDGDAT